MDIAVGRRFWTRVSARIEIVSLNVNYIALIAFMDIYLDFQVEDPGFDSQLAPSGFLALTKRAMLSSGGS